MAQELQGADSLAVKEKRFTEKVFDLFTSGVTVSSDDIENSPIKNFGDVLKRYRAADVTSFGIYGQPQIASLWGGTSELTCISLDNIPYRGQALYFPQTGEFDLNTLSFRNIRRIEIYDGPVSDVLGHSAGLGCLNIVAKDYEGEEPYSRASFQRGGDGYRHTMLELGRDFLSRGRLYLTGEFRKYGGRVPRSFSQSRHLTGKFSFKPNRSWEMSFYASHYNADTEIAQFPDALLQAAKKEQSDWTLDLRSSHQISENTNLTFDLLYNPRNQKLKGEGGFFPQEKNEKAISLKAALEKELLAHHLVLRGLVRKNSLDQDRNPHRSLWEGELSLADLFQLDERLAFLLFAKGAKFDELDPDLSAVGGLSYTLRTGLDLFSTLGWHHSYPSVHDLYLDLSFRGARPYDSGERLDYLKDTEMLALNGGARLVKTRFRASLTAMYSKIKGNILWIEDRPEKRDTDVFGIHHSFKVIPQKNFETYLSYAYKKSRYQESNNKFLLPFVPTHGLFCYTQYKNEKLKTGLGGTIRLEAEFLSSRYMEYKEENQEPEVLLLNAKFDLRFLDFHFYYVIENITDQEYRTRKEFEMDGRTQWWGFYWEFFD